MHPGMALMRALRYKTPQEPASAPACYLQRHLYHRQHRGIRIRRQLVRARGVAWRQQRTFSARTTSPPQTYSRGRGISGISSAPYKHDVGRIARARHVSITNKAATDLPLRASPATYIRLCVEACTREKRATHDERYTAAPAHHAPCAPRLPAAPPSSHTYLPHACCEGTLRALRAGIKAQTAPAARTARTALEGGGMPLRLTLARLYRSATCRDL